MKGKAVISKQDLDFYQDKSIYIIGYNKVVEDIKKESNRRKCDSIGNDSVDFETAISKAGYGKFNYLLLLLSIPAASSSSWVTGAISFVLPAAGCDMDLTSLDKGLLNSAPYAGMVLSAFFWGLLSDTFGRQRLLTVGFLIDSVMGICASFSPTLVPMLFFKFMSGIMVCGPYSIFMAYISEVFLDKHRRLAVSLAGIFSAIGNLFQPALALFLIPPQISWNIWGYKYSSWRVFLFICSIPSLMCGIASAFCVESPKFLLEKGRKDEALNVFQTIYTLNTGQPVTTYPVRKLLDARTPSVIARSENEPQKSFFQILQNGGKQAFNLLKPPFLLRALFIFSIQLGSVTSLNVLRLWLPQMYSAIDTVSTLANSTTTREPDLCMLLTESAKNKEELVCDNMVIKPDLYWNMIWINIGPLFTQSFYVILVKYVNKKIIISATTSIAAACILSITLVSTNHVVTLTCFILSALNITFFCIIGCVVEIFPTTVRATSVSLTMMCGRIGILLANIAVASIMYTHCNEIFYTSFTALMVIAVSSLFLSLKPIDRKSVSTSRAKTLPA